MCPSGARISPSTCPNDTVCGLLAAIGGPLGVGGVEAVLAELALAPETIVLVVVVTSTVPSPSVVVFVSVTVVEAMVAYADNEVLASQ